MGARLLVINFFSPPTGERPAHYTTLGVILSQVARNIRRQSLPTGRQGFWEPSSTTFEPGCEQWLRRTLVLLPLQSSLPGMPAR